MYKWPLNINNATWLDRLKLCCFVLNPKNRWTQDKYVSRFEREMAGYIGVKYALFVSSGSAANTILAMYLKDTTPKTKNTIVFPATTWSTSVSPFIREGFKPHFIDITLKDLSINLELLEKYLIDNHKKVACVFITSLLGFSPNIDELFRLEKKYNVRIMMDNCESTLTKYEFGGFNWGETSNISYPFTSTTSTYFGHCLNTNEGGFIFTNNQEEYEKFLLYRNHGMTRSLINPSFMFEVNDNIYEKYRNPKVDARFDFYNLGNNFRNTEFNAFLGLLDLKKANTYLKLRRLLYEYFYSDLNYSRYIIIGPAACDVPFSLPIIVKGDDKDKRILKIKEYCEKNSIETRPIISGCLLNQTAFKKFGDIKNYPISQYIENYGLYVGLYSKLKKEKIIKLVDYLNRA
jgi:CDP-4-dehydro-6-deoxyglucose reductase, E1